MPAHGIQQGIALEPRIARKARVGRPLQPDTTFVQVTELRERRAEAVRDVMIHVRTRRDGCGPCARLVGHSRCGLDRRKRRLRTSIRLVAPLRGRQHLPRTGHVADVVACQAQIVANRRRVGPLE